MAKTLSQIPYKLSSKEKAIMRKEIAITKNAKTKAARDVRSVDILQQLKSGMSRANVLDYLQKKYDVKMVTAIHYLTDAYKLLAEQSRDYIADLRQVQLDRLETILQDAMANKNWKIALQTIDIINKTFALYEIKTTVQIESNNVKFKFGNQDLVSNSVMNNDKNYYGNDERGFANYEEIKEVDQIEAGNGEKAEE